MPVMKQLGGFLGLERSEDFYQRVVAQTSFDNVKAFRDAANAGKTLLNPGKSLYRKGQVGDWINHLTVAQSRRFDKMAEDYQIDCIFEL